MVANLLFLTRVRRVGQLPEYFRSLAAETKNSCVKTVAEKKVRCRTRIAFIELNII